MTTRQWIVAGMLVVASGAQASEYTFKDLAMKDYADMEKLVLKTCGSNVIDDDEREPKVREALHIVLARKNTDGKRSALFIQLQGLLPDAFFQLAVQKVAESAVSQMKESTSSNLTKATAFITLENLLAEIQPRANDYRSTIEIVQKADIEISDGLRSYRRLEGMDINDSPSSIAQNILDKTPVAEKAPEPVKKSDKSVALINPDFIE
jgi:hypothetical protein